jgi:hypothetical protein
VTGIGYNPEFESWQEKAVVLFSKMSRPALESTKPPVQGVPEFFSGEKAAGA